MEKRNIVLLFTGIIFLFFFFRLYHLEQQVNFGADQGLQLLEIRHLFESKKLSLIGPYSSFDVDGKHFFFGSAPYYLPMGILILFQWHPLSMSYFLILLQFLSMIAVCIAIIRVYKSWLLAVCFAFLFSVMPSMVQYSRFFWNPNFLIPITGFTLSAILFLRKNLSLPLFLAIGFLLGFGLQFHYSFFLSIVVSLLLMLSFKKRKKKGLMVLLLGFITGFSPIILFELRHDFYNIKTLALYMSLHKNFQFFEYYILSLYPFFLFFLSHECVYIAKKKSIVAYVFFFFLFLYSCILLLPLPSHGVGMVEGWNYQGVKKVVNIILEEKKPSFNVADFLSGDTRAMSVRYLLTVHGFPPLDVDQYPATEYLYLYSKLPIDTLLTGSSWELDSIKPAKVEKQWEIQHGIFLYLLKRQPKENHLYP